MAHIGPNELCTQLSYNDARTAPFNQDVPGAVWDDLDVTLGSRRFKFVSVKATSAALAVGDVVVWTNNYANVVSTAQADSSRNCLAGVAQAVISISKYGWIQTDGYIAGVKCDASVFALGKQVIISSSDKTATIENDGTAPTYPKIGTALTVSAGGLVPTHLHCGKLSPN